jgi:AhpD family alkylhydroperoxidase
MSPALFGGFVDMALAIKRVDDLDSRDIELVIVRTAQLRHGRYQLYQHSRLARRAGISDAELRGLPNWRRSRLFSERQKALLDFVEGSLSRKGVSTKTYAGATAFFSKQQLVEIALISGYAASSCQVTNTFDIPIDVND